MRRRNVLLLIATVLAVVIHLGADGMTTSAQNSLIGNYDINANGFTGVLTIASIDANGNITGSVLGDQMFGFYDDTTKKIFFRREIDPSDPNSIQIFSGYLFTGSQS